MRPDPDAIGSQAGLKEVIQHNYPDKEVYIVGDDPGDLSFLSSMDSIESDTYSNALVIVVDTANTDRISDRNYSEGKDIIKIDHHPNEEPYGSIQWVDASSSSTCELIADLVKSTPELTLNSEAARLLYAGIVGDTNRFLYPATSTKTMELAGFLMEQEFSHTEVNDAMNQVELKIARLKGYVLQNLQVNSVGVGHIVLTKKILKDFDLVDSDTSAVVSLPGGIQGIEAWVIFVQQQNKAYRCRIRSKRTVINEIAKKHEGGGHPLASGANAKDEKEISEILNELTDAVQQKK